MENLVKIEFFKAELRGEFDYSAVLYDISIEFDEIKTSDAINKFWLSVNLDELRFVG